MDADLPECKFVQLAQFSAVIHPYFWQIIGYWALYDPTEFIVGNGRPLLHPLTKDIDHKYKSDK